MCPVTGSETPKEARAQHECYGGFLGVAARDALEERADGAPPWATRIHSSMNAGGVATTGPLGLSSEGPLTRGEGSGRICSPITAAGSQC